MYQDFYQFSADPFRLSPDVAFCFHYPSFAKARAYLQYALGAAEGFVMVTGSPGMGKTTLINDLLSGCSESNYLTATLVNTQLAADELLRMLAYEFGLDVHALDKATALQRLKQFLIQARKTGRRPLLIVDEAQNLSMEALEELRLLTNLQWDNVPLLQIFLVGQENLRTKLQDVELEQLRQRITATCQLDQLSLEQTTAYIIHRLRVAGWQDIPEINVSVFPIVQRTCHGIPRRINRFCGRLLLHGSLEQKTELTAREALLVSDELGEEQLGPNLSPEITTEDSESDAAGLPRLSPIAGETLLQAAEDLLKEQQYTNRQPAPVTITSSEPEPNAPSESSRVPPVPTVAPPTRRVGEQEGTGRPPEWTHRPKRRRRRLSVWAPFAYTASLLAIIGSAVFLIPDKYLQHWLPHNLSGMVNETFASQSYFSQLTNPESSARPSPRPQKPQMIPRQENTGVMPLAAPAEIIPEQEISSTTPVVKPGAKPAIDEDLKAVSPEPEPVHEAQVSFDFDSTKIRSQDHRVLDEIATSLSESNEWVAQIFGYTDGVGPKNYNRRLSRLRAQAVADYLTSRGVSPDRLHIEGKGTIDQEGDHKHRLSARRVRITLTPVSPTKLSMTSNPSH